MSALPLIMGLNSKEMTLLKLFFFPLAARCFCDNLLSKGYLPKFKHSDIVAYCLISGVITYAFMYEKISASNSLNKSIDLYIKTTNSEHRFLTLLGLVTHRRMYRAA